MRSVRRRYQRSHLGGRRGGIADHQAADRGLEQLHEPVQDRALDQDPGPGAAVLPGVVEHRVRRGRRGLLQVGVGEDDVGALAAELQGEPFDLARAVGHDPLAHLGGPGEDDLAHRGVIDQALPDHAALARQHLEHPLRQARLQRQLADPHRGQRGGLGGLGHDGAPRGQRGRHAPGQDRHREVPRHDEADHADGLVKGDVQPAGNRDLPAAQPLRRRRVVLQHVADLPGLPPGRPDGMARAGHLKTGQFLRRGVHRRGERAQHPGAVPGRDGPPGRQRGRGPGDGLIRLLQRGLGQRGDRLLGRGVEHGKRGHASGTPDHRRSKPRRSSQSVTAAS